LISGIEFSIILNKVNRIQYTEDRGVSHPLRERQNVEGRDQRIRISGSGYQDIGGSELKTTVLTSVNPCPTEPNLKKQSQSSGKRISINSYMKGIYSNKSPCGPVKTKPIKAKYKSQIGQGLDSRPFSFVQGRLFAGMTNNKFPVSISVNLCHRYPYPNNGAEKTKPMLKWAKWH
jgi:hypothetical protein